MRTKEEPIDFAKYPGARTEPIFTSDDWEFYKELFFGFVVVVLIAIFLIVAYLRGGKW